MRVGRVLLLVAGVGLAVGAGAFWLFRLAREEVAGGVRAERTPVGSFAFTVDDCASGQAFVPGFFGADLRGGRGQGTGREHDLRVVGSGEEAQLWLFPPGATRGAILFGKGDCARWDVRTDWARVRVNRVDTVSGHVHVTCRGSAGALTADVEFVRCGY